MRKGADTVKSILSNAPEPGDAGLIRYAEVYLPRFEVLNEKRGVTRYEQGCVTDVLVQNLE